VSAISTDRPANTWLVAGAVAWTLVAGAIAIPALRSVDDGPRVLVLGATMLGLALGALGAMAATQDRRRVAAAALVASAIVTPTYFAAAVNLVPLALGVVAFRRR
jgi:hypothetical protein